MEVITTKRISDRQRTVNVQPLLSKQEEDNFHVCICCDDYFWNTVLQRMFNYTKGKRLPARS